MTVAAAEVLSAPLALAAAGLGIAWWCVLGIVALVRRPPRITRSARDAHRSSGLDVPDEPPAVAGMLANGFVITAETAPAVLLDLAARDLVAIDEVQPGRTICRLREEDTSGLTDAEALVLAELRSKAVDGVVPSEALTTGPEAQSKRWHHELAAAVIADAQQRGLTVPRWPGPLVGFLASGLAAIGVLVALAIWAGDSTATIDATIDPVALGAVVVGVVACAVGAAVTARLLGSLAQLPTPAGEDAAARALALAERLRDNEVLATLPPAGVTLWDRLFAYAAAFGAAPVAVALLPMGAEDDRHAWSRSGDRWRRVTVSYPRAWPPAWGKHPVLAFAFAAFWGVLAGAVLFGLAQIAAAEPPASISDAAWSWVERAALVASVPVVAVLAISLGIVVRSIPDIRQSVEVRGLIVRERRKRQVFSSGDEPDYSYYLAIDDGSRSHVRALRVRESLWQERSQGEQVRAVVSPRLGFVRSIAVE